MLIHMLVDYLSHFMENERFALLNCVGLALLLVLAVALRRSSGEATQRVSALPLAAGIGVTLLLLASASVVGSWVKRLESSQFDSITSRDLSGYPILFQDKVEGHYQLSNSLFLFGCLMLAGSVLVVWRAAVTRRRHSGHSRLRPHPLLATGLWLMLFFAVFTLHRVLPGLISPSSENPWEALCRLRPPPPMSCVRPAYSDAAWYSGFTNLALDSIAFFLVSLLLLRWAERRPRPNAASSPFLLYPSLAVFVLGAGSWTLTRPLARDLNRMVSDRGFVTELFWASAKLSAPQPVVALPVLEQATETKWAPTVRLHHGRVEVVGRHADETLHATGIDLGPLEMLEGLVPIKGAEKLNPVEVERQIYDWMYMLGCGRAMARAELGSFLQRLGLSAEAAASVVSRAPGESELSGNQGGAGNTDTRSADFRPSLLNTVRLEADADTPARWIAALLRRLKEGGISQVQLQTRIMVGVEDTALGSLLHPVSRFLTVRLIDGLEPMAEKALPLPERDDYGTWAHEADRAAVSGEVRVLVAGYSGASGARHGGTVESAP